MKTTIFTIERMQRDGCARTVEALLGAESGVHKVEASFATGRARVLHDPGIASPDDLVAAVERGRFRIGRNPS